MRMSCSSGTRHVFAVCWHPVATASLVSSGSYALPCSHTVLAFGSWGRCSSVSSRAAFRSGLCGCGSGPNFVFVEWHDFHQFQQRSQLHRRRLCSSSIHVRHPHVFSTQDQAVQKLKTWNMAEMDRACAVEADTWLEAPIPFIACRSTPLVPHSFAIDVDVPHE